MNEQVFKLLNDKIDKVEIKVDKMATNVEKMLAFKWQIVGGSVVISLLAGLVVQIIIAYITRGG